MNAYIVAVLFVICVMLGMVVAKVMVLAGLAMLGFAVLGGAYILYKGVTKIFGKDKA